MKTEKLKQEDLFYNEMGFEEEDVDPNIERLGIFNDPELKAIRDENEARSKKFLEERKVDTEKMQKQMEDMKAAAEKARLAAEKQKAEQLSNNMGLGGGAGSEADAALH